METQFGPASDTMHSIAPPFRSGQGGATPLLLLLLLLCAHLPCHLAGRQRSLHPSGGAAAASHVPTAPGGAGPASSPSPSPSSASSPPFFGRQHGRHLASVAVHPLLGSHRRGLVPPPSASSSSSSASSSSSLLLLLDDARQLPGGGRCA
jgi:hypothetical protein